MKLSLGVMAYNEEKNIGRILNAILNQKTDKIDISEIIVVSSGSTDNTNKIIKNFVNKNKKIKLIIQKNREGKASAINKFLKVAKSKILVLESGDTIPKNDAIEKLCTPLEDKKIGIVGGHPIPKKNKDFLHPIIELQWSLHHKISLKKPKFGEIIAFKKIFKKIENTAVDEEHIAMLIKNKGLKGFYAKDAIVYNFGPETVKDLLNQRRRIYCGHLKLKKNKEYLASSMRKFLVLKTVLKEINIGKFTTIILGIFLEIIGRILGTYDYYFGTKHEIWAVPKTYKKNKLF